MIICFLATYFGISLLGFFVVWKESEMESDDFRNLPRKGKIICRLLAILFWPVYLVPCTIQLICNLLRREE